MVIDPGANCGSPGGEEVSPISVPPTTSDQSDEWSVLALRSHVTGPLAGTGLHNNWCRSQLNPRATLSFIPSLALDARYLV